MQKFTKDKAHCNQHHKTNFHKNPRLFCSLHRAAHGFYPQIDAATGMPICNSPVDMLTYLLAA